MKEREFRTKGIHFVFICSMFVALSLRRSPQSNVDDLRAKEMVMNSHRRERFICAPFPRKKGAKKGAKEGKRRESARLRPCVARTKEHLRQLSFLSVSASQALFVLFCGCSIDMFTGFRRGQKKLFNASISSERKFSVWSRRQTECDVFIIARLAGQRGSEMLTRSRNSRIGRSAAADLL